MLAWLACTAPEAIDTGTCDPELPDPVEELGDATTDTGSRYDGPTQEELAEARAAFFDPFTVQPVFVTIDEASQDALRKDPRTYVPASFSHGTTRLDEIGVKVKGSSSFLPWDEKPSLKLRLDAFVEGQRYLGLERITLNNMVQDEAQAGEVFSYELLQRADQLAPRASYAELFVRASDDDGWESFGLYANVESIDERFLMHHGLVPGRLWEADEDCDFTDGEVWNFEAAYGDGDREQLQDVTDTLDEAGTLGATSELVDDQQFLDFWAWSITFANSDGYPYRNDDFYAYEHDTDGRLTFVPWGLDETWNRGSEALDLEGRLATVCVDEAACRTRFDETVSAAIETYWSLGPAELLQELYGLSQPYVDDDERRPYDLDVVADERDELESDADGWVDELADQLDL